jgi:hypothetical protein
MPTNRPFLANFLAAFRAHSALPKPSTSPAGVSASSQPSHPSNVSASVVSNASTNPRSIATKSPGPTTAALQSSGQFSTSQSRQHSTSPLSRSPMSPASPSSRADGSSRRRGSDSSAEGGFRDVLGSEKWYIGGRSAAGEEKFYRLGMVKRHGSIDRLSLDRLSL